METEEKNCAKKTVWNSLINSDGGVPRR